jgi:sec-independent protein translocase protein TatB
MFGIGPIEFAVVLVVALLVMGPKKLPELARTIGRGLAEFRRASNDLRRSIDLDIESHKIEPPPGPAQASSPHEATEQASEQETKQETKQETGQETGQETEQATEQTPEQTPEDPDQPESEKQLADGDHTDLASEQDPGDPPPVKRDTEKAVD